MRASLKDSLKNIMISYSNNPSIEGVISLHYLAQSTANSSTLEANDTDGQIGGGNSFVLYSLLGFVSVTLFAMVCMGTLGRKYCNCSFFGRQHKDRQYQQHPQHQPLDESTLGDEDQDRSGDQVDVDYSYWNRGWENVTRAYDQAVEVCMEKKNLITGSIS